MGRFKDEEVKAKFKDVGKAAEKFGEDLSSTVKKNRDSVKQKVATKKNKDIEKIEDLEKEMEALKKKISEAKAAIRKKAEEDEE